MRRLQESVELELWELRWRIRLKQTFMGARLE